MSFLPSLFLSPTPPTLKLIDFFFFDLLLHMYDRYISTTCRVYFTCLYVFGFRTFLFCTGAVTNYGAHSWQKPVPPCPAVISCLQIFVLLFPPIVNVEAMNIAGPVSVNSMSSPLDICHGTVQLDHMPDLLLVFKDSSY